jgi:hypothetical protein
VLISDAVGVKYSMLLVKSYRYGLYAVAGVEWLVVSTSLLLLLIRARMKGGRSISANYAMIELNTASAIFGKSFLSASWSILRLHVIMISLSIHGRDLGISGGSVGFFFLRDMVVNGFPLLSATAVMCVAQVRLSVVGLCGCGVAGVYEY